MTDRQTDRIAISMSRVSTARQQCCADARKKCESAGGMTDISVTCTSNLAPQPVARRCHLMKAGDRLFRKFYDDRYNRFA